MSPLPDLQSAKVTHAWGGAIDVSADHLPFFGTIPDTRIHYGCGYSGHGVNPTYIGGQTLASLALGIDDEWTSLPFCTRNDRHVADGADALRRSPAGAGVDPRVRGGRRRRRRAPLIARAGARLPSCSG